MDLAKLQLSWYQSKAWVMIQKGSAGLLWQEAYCLYISHVLRFAIFSTFFSSCKRQQEPPPLSSQTWYSYPTSRKTQSHKVMQRGKRELQEILNNIYVIYMQSTELCETALAERCYLPLVWGNTFSWKGVVICKISHHKLQMDSRR